METRISLSLHLPEDTIFGTCTLYVSQWEEAVMVRNAPPLKLPVVLRPLDVEKSVIPYAIAALREAGDNMIAELLAHLERGSEIMLHDVDYVKET